MSRTRSRPSSRGSRTASSTRSASLGCSISLRGNRLTLAATASTSRPRGRSLTGSSSSSREAPDRADTVGAVLTARDQAKDVRDVFEDVVWRHRGRRSRRRPSTRSATSTRSARDGEFSVGPAGTGKTYLAMALAVAALSEGEVGRDHPHAPRGRGRRAARVPPGDMLAKVDPYMRPLYDALYDMLEAERLAGTWSAGRSRSRRSLHAREDAERLLHRPRRGTEHDARADADVPHAPRLRVEDGRDRRHHAGRPAAEQASGLIQVREILAGIEASPSSSSGTRTSSGTSSCSGSSRRTSATPRRPERRAAGRRAVISVETRIAAERRSRGAAVQLRAACSGRGRPRRRARDRSSGRTRSRS